MGLFANIFNKIKLFNSTAGAEWEPFFGSSTSGKKVNVSTAMQISAVYACVRILSESVAQLPLNVFEETEIGKVKAKGLKLYKLLHDEPNPEMDAFTFIEMAMTHLCLWGNFYAQIIRNGKNEIIALYPLMANKMTVDRDTTTGELFYEYQHETNEANTVKGSTIRFKKDEIFHIVGLGYDGLIGYSPIAIAKNTIGMTIACEEYGSKFFNNGARPGGVLEHPGIIKNPDRVRENWQATYGGSGNAGKIAVLEEGMKYTPISINPSEAQFLETRKFQLNEIARIYRIPPHLIGDLDKSSFSNIEQQSIEFVKYTLEPWLVRFEKAIFRQLLSDEEKEKYFIKFNIGGLLRGEYESRTKGYQSGIQNGWMSPNDVRELEDLDLIPEEKGGNNYMVNGNMLLLEKVGAYSDKQNNSERSDINGEVLEVEKFSNKKRKRQDN